MSRLISRIALPSAGFAHRAWSQIGHSVWAPFRNASRPAISGLSALPPAKPYRRSSQDKQAAAVEGDAHGRIRLEGRSRWSDFVDAALASGAGSFVDPVGLIGWSLFDVVVLSEEVFLVGGAVRSDCFGSVWFGL